MTVWRVKTGRTDMKRPFRCAYSSHQFKNKRFKMAMKPWYDKAKMETIESGVEWGSSLFFFCINRQKQPMQPMPHIYTVIDFGFKQNRCSDT